MGSLNLPFFCPQQSWTGNASGQSLSFDVASFRTVLAVLDVQFLSGATPTLGVSLETSLDKENWFTLGTPWVVTPAGLPFSDVVSLDELLRYVRANGDLTSNPPSEENPGKAFFSLKGIAMD